MTQDTDAIKRSVKYINGQVGNVGKVLDQIIDVWELSHKKHLL